MKLLINTFNKEFGKRHVSVVQWKDGEEVYLTTADWLHFYCDMCFNKVFCIYKGSLYLRRGE